MAHLLTLWVLLSLPFGILTGKFIAVGGRCEIRQDDTNPIIRGAADHSPIATAPYLMPTVVSHDTSGATGRARQGRCPVRRSPNGGDPA
jgi:hypothetical protein